MVNVGKHHEDAKLEDLNKEVQNFSLNVLASLKIAGGLESSPVNGLEALATVSYRPSTKLICFPWGVVESKKDGHGEDVCVCQAANAALTALSIMNGLMPPKYREITGDTIPPFVAFTTIGPKVRLWLAYDTSIPDGKPNIVRFTSFEDSLNC
jgi:hypothetical protein